MRPAPLLVTSSWSSPLPVQETFGRQRQKRVRRLRVLFDERLRPPQPPRRLPSPHRLPDFQGALAGAGTVLPERRIVIPNFGGSAFAPIQRRAFAQRLGPVVGLARGGAELFFTLPPALAARPLFLLGAALVGGAVVVQFGLQVARLEFAFAFFAHGHFSLGGCARRGQRAPRRAEPTPNRSLRTDSSFR